MPRAFRQRPCDECGEELSTASKETRSHPGACAQKGRVRRLLEKGARMRAEEYVASPVRVLPAPGGPVPLVPPLTSHGCHVTPGSGQKKTIRSRTHLIIPDCQVHEGVPTEHLDWVGKYIAAKRPDVIVCIGDFADMPSLCSYDKGKKSFEGRRYVNDIEAARAAMDRLTSHWRDIPDYKPRMVLTLGNHEDRITRAVEDAAVLEGAIGLHDLAYESFGWEVHPYLEIVTIDGIEYSHYFAGQGAKGFAVCSARALLNARGGSDRKSTRLNSSH